MSSNDIQVVIELEPKEYVVDDIAQTTLRKSVLNLTFMQMLDTIYESVSLETNAVFKMKQIVIMNMYPL